MSVAGFAAGVMLCLSILDLAPPALLRHGSPVQGLIAIASGYALVLLLNYVLDSFDAEDQLLSLVAKGGEAGNELPARVTNSSGRPTLELGNGWPAAAPSHTGASHSSAHASPTTLHVPSSSDQGRAHVLRSAMLTALALAAHNAPEGLAVGISAMSDEGHRALLVLVAIALHNIPEGLAVAVALLNAAVPPWMALLTATATGLVEPIAALISVLFLQNRLSPFVLDMSLAVVAGVMLTVCVQELLPQAWRSSPRSCLTGTFTGAITMAIILHLLEEA
ncbi:uncharacterized protein MONBRDRAFT_22299 [Monosiga brevicollis MX1]|uniref:Zinc/iron permease n=1 Tax=Monosiga brevicollis TaxID=81824 RepID=A9UQ60_MONBE|nr:uncharacterized protein MONBRDRAFT_22299 [Monosiga brevicollis MX1]EDQ92539.1 predicted protein [Monosiga brevicollis MX1]|eukprot:XP_001742301.1 hypothetical protein [Monosiga brevicollis MX1]